ncbi:MAG TPA: hypothetical protein VIT92_02175, partial [Burkholderiaceae bacterium]
FAPLALTFGAVWTQSASLAVMPLLLLTLLAFIAIIAAVARRHAVEIQAAQLTVRHSLYTFSIKRSEVDAVSVIELADPGQLGLSIRTNGIAAFGYLSGWFRRGSSGRTFCAIAKGPLYLVSFEGRASCKHLALSANPELASAIAAWAPAQ